MRARGLAHAIELKQWYVEAHEELNGFGVNRRRTCEGDLDTVQTNTLVDLLQNKLVGNVERPGQATPKHIGGNMLFKIIKKNNNPLFCVKFDFWLY